MVKLVKNSDFVLGLVLSSLSLWYLKTATTIRFGASHPVDIGPRAMPQIYGTLLLVLSLLLIVKALRDKNETAGSDALKELITPLLSIGLTVLYAFLLPRIGFMISSTLLLLGLTRILTDRKQNWWRLLLIYVVFVVAIFFVFDKLFLVDFPEPLLEMWGM